MHWKLHTWLFIILVTICGNALSADSKPGTLQIDGFRYGLIEFDSNQKPRIYEAGNEFTYKVNGTCVANRKEVPCQWRGFEFSYNSPDEVTVFECVTTSDRPQDYVNPHAVAETDSQIAHWRFYVEGFSGYYIRPQYTTDLGARPLRMKTSCSNKGKEVLQWQVILTPPKNE